jgi:cold shock CspA family protein
MSNTTENTQAYLKCNGCVKWFNSKTGFGFITITGDSELAQKDIFVHHSAIQTSTKLYKYLVQGEYVSVDVGKVENGTHEYQVLNVGGIDGGKLMCETRHIVSSRRPPRRSNIPTLDSTQSLERSETTGQEVFDQGEASQSNPF